jgi:3-oxoacyl-[acyl-carrier-protein] synthase II
MRSDLVDSPRRVVITGLGAVTPRGNDVTSAWHAIAAEDISHGVVPALPPGGSVPKVLRVRDFDPRSYFKSPKSIKLADRKAQLAVAAAVMAFGDAALDSAPLDRERIGISMGSGNVELQVEDLAKAIGPGADLRPATDLPFFARQILSNLNPLWLLVSLPNMISAHVSIQLQVMGPNTTWMTDWIAGAQAVGEAWLWIRSGEADCVLAGGADSSISPLDMFGWDQVESRCNPLEGCSAAEGAAVLVLEEMQSALGRRAHIYGEICGYASAGIVDEIGLCDAIFANMSAALEHAGWSSEELGLICLTSTGKGILGNEENRAIRQLLKRPQGELPVVEFKSRLGHLLAACTPAEMALLLQEREAGPLTTRVLVNSIGSNGQLACVAVTIPARAEEGASAR